MDVIVRAQQRRKLAGGGGALSRSVLPASAGLQTDSMHRY